MSEPSPITYQHYAAFGGIINAFARIDILLSGMIASMIGGDEELTGVLLTFVDNRDKRDFISAMIGASDLPPSSKATASNLLERVKKASVLRNSIAHDAWIAGDRPAAIKPLAAKARGKLKISGLTAGEKGWTAAELAEEIKKYDQLRAEISAFMQAHSPTRNGE